MAHSAVGVELGQPLQSGITADMSDGARRGEIVEALREACGQDPVAYTRLVELVFVAASSSCPTARPRAGPRSCRRRRPRR